jgi:hypothetical protein
MSAPPGGLRLGPDKVAAEALQATVEKGRKGALEAEGTSAYKRADPPLPARESVLLRPEVPKGFR